MPDDNPWVRVTDKDTGHKLSIRESAVPHGNYAVLKQDATDLGGDPLPPEFKDASASTTSSSPAKES